MPSLRERFLCPRAGWLSLGLLTVMALAVAWSVQGAGWLDQMEFLAPVALWGVVFRRSSGCCASASCSRFRRGAHPAFVVLWTIGGEYFVDLDQAGQLLALRTDFIDWLVIILRTGYPPQMSPYAIGLGALMFATAFAAGYAVYRHHRVLDAILLLGAAIIVNMSATFTDLFGHLLLFVIAALLLWLRAARPAAGRVAAPARQREPRSAGGVLAHRHHFAAASVGLAWVLTSVAVAASTDTWRSFDGVWTGVRDQFEGVFGTLTNPQSRITGNSFGPAFVVQGEWVSVDDEAIVLAAPSPYLRTVTYDHYTGRGWDSTQAVRRQVAPSAFLFEGLTSERPTIPESVEIYRIAVEMEQTIRRNLFTPPDRRSRCTHRASFTRAQWPSRSSGRLSTPTRSTEVVRARRRDLDRPPRLS